MGDAWCGSCHMIRAHAVADGRTASSVSKPFVQPTLVRVMQKATASVRKRSRGLKQLSRRLEYEIKRALFALRVAVSTENVMELKAERNGHLCRLNDYEMSKEKVEHKVCKKGLFWSE